MSRRETRPWSPERHHVVRSHREVAQIPRLDPIAVVVIIFFHLWQGEQGRCSGAGAISDGVVTAGVSWLRPAPAHHKQGSGCETTYIPPFDPQANMRQGAKQGARRYGVARADPQLTFCGAGCYPARRWETAALRRLPIGAQLAKPPRVYF